MVRQNYNVHISDIDFLLSNGGEHIDHQFNKTLQESIMTATNLFDGPTGTDDQSVDEVEGNADHRAEGEAESEDLRPRWVCVDLVVRQQLELDAHPQEDALNKTACQPQIPSRNG